MNKKIVGALTISVIAVVMCVGLASAFVSSSNPYGMYAEVKLTRYVFRGVGDSEFPWQYIYLVNPTWQTAVVKSVKIDCYVNGVYQPWPLSCHLTPDWKPERWDTVVHPFEKSVFVYFGYLVGEGEPQGRYVQEITVYAIVMGQDIELKTRCVYWVFL